jgi:hypothetical protein
MKEGAMPHEAAVLIGMGQSGTPVEVSLDRGLARPEAEVGAPSGARFNAIQAPNRDIR